MSPVGPPARIKAPALALLFIAPAMACATPSVPPGVAPPDFAWWREARLGMFIRWGPSSITGREISWSRGDYGKEKYDALYKEFNPVKFNAAEWVATAKAAGMRYLVLTAKHHDGFMLWNTKTDPYNIMNTPFGRDVVAELAAAANAASLPFCVYFSPGDWRDPDCRHPQNNPRFVERMHAQLTELLRNYGKIPLVWIDFDGFPNPSHPRDTATLLRTLQPGVLLTNRLEALHTDESHGRVGPWGDYATPEQFVGSYCDSLPWETCMTIAGQWSWKPDDKLKSLRRCIETLVRTASGDGNLLFNVGPRPDGEIEPAQLLRLKEMGAWLQANGEAIYATRGGPYLPTGDYSATRTARAVYVHVFADSPEQLALPALPLAIRTATRLDGTPVTFEQTASALTLEVPKSSRDPSVTVVKLTVEGDPLAVAVIPPASTTGSLAYRRPISASSSLTPLFMHPPSALVDDNPSTYWVPGRDETVVESIHGKTFEAVRHDPAHPVWLRDAALVVDLGETREVKRLVLLERTTRPEEIRAISSWTLEYSEFPDGPWKQAAAGATVGARLDLTLPAPVKGRHFRLAAASTGRFALSEFQLF